MPTRSRCPGTGSSALPTSAFAARLRRTLWACCACPRYGVPTFFFVAAGLDVQRGHITDDVFGNMTDTLLQLHRRGFRGGARYLAGCVGNGAATSDCSSCDAEGGKARLTAGGGRLTPPLTVRLSHHQQPERSNGEGKKRDGYRDRRPHRASVLVVESNRHRHPGILFIAPVKRLLPGGVSRRPLSKGRSRVTYAIIG